MGKEKIIIIPIPHNLPLKLVIEEDENEKEYKTLIDMLNNLFEIKQQEKENV